MNDFDDQDLNNNPDLQDDFNQTPSHPSHGWRRFITAQSIVVTAMLIAAAVVALPHIHADPFQDQINQLRIENSQNQNSVDTLLLQARSVQDAIDKLQAEINLVEQNIATNQARQDELQKQIAAKQEQIDAQRKVLGDDIKAMYVDGQLTALEMLATSKNLNEFVDTATYRESVQRNIQKTLNEIGVLQNQLQQRNFEVSTLLASQKVQSNQLAANKSKQAALLAMNQTQQLDFNAKISANQDRIHQLEMQQAALNAMGATLVTVNGDEKGGDCDNGWGNGGYRMASITQPPVPAGAPAPAPVPDVCDAPKDSIRDWAGIENRECTSYAYWYFKRVLGNVDFTASGDAKYWVNTSNYPVRDQPAVGAIGVKTEGDWGHVVIVQAVGPSMYKNVKVPAGQVLTSEMNIDFQGHFSYNLRTANTLHYIYK